METLNTLTTNQELPLPPNLADRETEILSNVGLSGEYRPVQHAASQEPLSKRKSVSITAAAARAKTTTLILLAIGAAIYMLIGPVSS